MPTSLQMALGNEALTASVRRSRQLLHKRALVGAAASVVPLPGLDWAVDAALLSKLIPTINAEFGLSPLQLNRLDPAKREQVQKIVSTVGSILVGKYVTRDLVLKAAHSIGLKLTAKQATKYVPLAGQAASALIGYMAIRHFGEQHIKDCVQVAKAAAHLLPPANPAIRAAEVLEI